MKQMKKFMVVHRDPTIPWSKVEENWRKLANVESATWIRTCYNKEKGVRYCVWLAPDESELNKLFSGLNISWESMLEVQETVPDLWGEKWEAHLEAEATADTLGAL
jgi:hypothetical protein